MPPPESPEVSRERESAADRYAAELTMRVGLPAFGALPALALFAAAEGETLDPQASHPLGTCRILAAMLDSVDRLAADERTVHLLDQSPDMMPGGERYEYFRTQMQTNCS
jgi:Zn-dependent protease with chaperone function